MDLASAEYRKQLLEVTRGEPVFTLTEDKIKEEMERNSILSKRKYKRSEDSDEEEDDIDSDEYDSSDSEDEYE